MTIGIDCRLWNQTGVGRYVRNLVKELGEINENKYVLFVRKQDYENLKSQISNLKYRENFKPVSVDIPWHSVKEQVLFPKVLKKENLDLMHFTYFSVPILYKKPYALTVHDLTLNHFKSGKASTRNFLVYSIKRNAYLFIMKKATKNARKIIAVSNATSHELVDHLRVPKDKISVIYEGVDKSVLAAGKSLISDPYVLYVGNVYPHKNAERAILAFFKASKPASAKFIFVGKEDFFYKSLRKKIQNLDKKKRVLFEGFVDDDSLSALYQNAKALIMPSLMEGLGLPVLEAMANKCLVLASDIPSLKEVAEDAALYFNPWDINDISRKIEIAFSSQNNEEYIKKGLKRSEDFSWEKMAKETLEVYEGSFSLRQG